MIGRVVSTKMQKTAVVLVERVVVHPVYKKTFIRTKKYLADDSLGVKDGDIVEMVKVRPISKNKHWKILKVMGKNLAEIVEARQKEAAAEAIAEVMLEEPGESDKKTAESKKKEVVMDNSAEKSKSRKKGRTELSKK